MNIPSKKRHIVKTITWRIVGTLDTVVLSWMISGDPLIGLKIGLAEVVTKMLLYYFHERAWFKFSIYNSRKRHIVKTITWRFIGSLDTLILAWFVTGDPLTGLKIGLAEVATKMILYYVHERVWYKLDFGLEKSRRSK
jgi:uncharacterized membrane protein